MAGKHRWSIARFVVVASLSFIFIPTVALAASTEGATEVAAEESTEILSQVEMADPSLEDGIQRVERETSEELETAEDILGDLTDGFRQDNSEELYDLYLQNRLFAFSGSKTRVMRRVRSAGNRLTGLNGKVYSALLQKVRDIADGKEASTEIRIPVYDFLTQTKWTKEELGLSSIYNENGEPSREAKQAVRDAIGYNAMSVVRSLLNDCAYELYWYDKTMDYKYINFNFAYMEGEETLYVSPAAAVTFKLAVAQEYRMDGPDNLYQVDLQKTGAAMAAVQKAGEIVESAAHLSDAEKLEAYRKVICELVSYDEAAATRRKAYGNAWQIVNVFDGDPATNVVCEGYAKAFQYLCDHTAFSEDIQCMTVTGSLAVDDDKPVSHMWNLVRFGDGKQYLVDLTNCDSGMIGEPDRLFLAGGKPVEGGYSVLGGLLTYLYDENTLSSYDPEFLIVSAGADPGRHPGGSADNQGSTGEENKKSDQGATDRATDDHQESTNRSNSGRQESANRSNSDQQESADQPNTGQSTTESGASPDQSADNQDTQESETIQPDHKSSTRENDAMTQRIICIIIGYILGMFLTAEVITRKLTGKPCSELGTSGNPGMANVMAHLGFKPGILVLAGDVGKTALAAGISYYLTGSALGHLAILYAGIGATLGHNYPLWNKFRGGKGVATTCATLVLFSFTWGVTADLCGFVAVLLSQYLCIGALVIPAVFAVLAFILWGVEAGIAAAVLAVLMAIKNLPDFKKISDGTVKKINLMDKLAAKFGSGNETTAAATVAGSGEDDAEEKPDARFMALTSKGANGMEHKNTDLVREHIVFYGRVQGVGFRYQATYAAQAFGVTGWVENMPDGTVEMEAQGTLLDIGKMLSRLQNGSWIRIESMETEERPVQQGEKGFKVRGY